MKVKLATVIDWAGLLVFTVFLGSSAVLLFMSIVGLGTVLGGTEVELLKSMVLIVGDIIGISGVLLFFIAIIDSVLAKHSLQK